MAGENRGLSPVLQRDSARLAELLALDFSSARIEVQCLLQAVLQVNRAYLLTHPERQLNAGQYARYMALFERRLNGEPIAYLLGEREFYGLTFRVTPDTLIPRPETELLVDLALQRIPQKPPSPPFDKHALSEVEGLGAGQAFPGGRGSKFRVLDMGTGSGAIALSIAHARPDAEVLACDASAAALVVARENAQQLGVANATFAQSDWFAALGAQRFGLIVSNPPYIAADDPHLTCGDVRFEPRAALVSGEDGLRDISRIVAEAAAHLHPGGWLLLEHGHDQAAAVRGLLRQEGFGGIVTARDLAGIERASGGHS